MCGCQDIAVVLVNVIIAH